MEWEWGSGRLKVSFDLKKSSSEKKKKKNRPKMRGLVLTIFNRFLEIKVNITNCTNLDCKIRSGFT